jgi:hypothetical protein
MTHHFLIHADGAVDKVLGDFEGVRANRRHSKTIRH